MDILNFIQTLGISNHPGFRFKENLEGYRDFTFGCKAGPVEPNITDLSHELAHAAQFGAKAFRFRAFSWGFNFKVPHKLICGQYISEPETYKGTLREIETVAFQLHLLQSGGIVVEDINAWFAETVSSFKYLPDFIHVPGNEESEKFSWCVDKAMEFYTMTNKSVVFKRLIGWLDATNRKLSKIL